MKNLRYCTFAAAAALIGAAVSAPVALAEDPPPPPEDVAGISQYIEEIPTGGGPALNTGLGGKSGTTPLSTRARRAIERAGGRDAASLEKIATSESYGAPNRISRSRGGASEPSALGAAFRAVNGMDGGSAVGRRMYGLLFVLLALVTAAIAAGLVRARPARAPR